MCIVLQSQNLRQKLLLKLRMIVLVEQIFPVLRLLEFDKYSDSRGKRLLRNGKRLLDFGFVLLLPEELEVVAVVEDAELRLVLARRKDVLAWPRAATDHLYELDARPDRLEEDKVQHLRHVDSRVEHVNGNGNPELGVMLELLDERIGIVHVVVHKLAPVVIMRIAFLNPLHNEVGVLVVVGEDDRLADCLSAFDLETALQHFVDYLVNGALVVHRVEDAARLDPVRRFVVERLVKLLALLVGAFPVGDAAT